MTRFASLIRPACLALAWLAVAVDAASAQGIERLGDYNNWSAFRFVEDGNAACYMASQPTKAEGEYSQRGDIYALVTHRPAENRRDEVSLIAGYPFKEDSLVEVTIGSQTFNLFTNEDGAWTANSDEDKRLVEAMIRGNQMVVKGTSSRGTLTTDTYSLSGFTKAYREMSSACAP